MTLRPLIIAAVLSLAALPASAADLSCTLNFSMTGWSAFYKHSEGSGTVSCSNGQKLAVKIEAKGGGLTVGKSKVTGKGKFAGVHTIRDVLGGYATGEANAAAGKAGKAQVVTKGPVSLALSGVGEGVELGISFGSFIISAR
ncbi:hypothetical protein [Lysobacter claricitrinus]|uniref:hypothetical protein n=1 Tax=Lysobacter claricitrinus TaxID=3367728 RepID=UPI0037DAA9CA